MAVELVKNDISTLEASLYFLKIHKNVNVKK
jgi:hypothetical protein